MGHVKMFGVALALLFVAYAFVLGPMPASAQGRGAAGMPAGVQATKSAKGMMMLVGPKGLTLYTFARDTPGVSNCNGICAKNQPPLMAAANATPMGNWTIVTRQDGSKQWAYKGMPLYGRITDRQPGDTTGDGLRFGDWKIAVP